MKKSNILLVTFSFLFSFSLVAQTMIIKDKDGVDITNGTYVFDQGGKDDWKASFTVELQSGDTVTRQIALRRYETKVCDGSQNYFCWTTCYGAVDAGVKPVWNDGPVTIEPDSVFTEFDAYYKENGTGKDADFLYVLYDNNNPTDSVTLLVKFDAGDASCETTTAINPLFNGTISIFPNPAQGFITIENGLRTDVVEIHDILGKRVYASANTSFRHDISELESGVYLVKVVRDGKLYDTRRIIKK